jgi:hypothetical protein
LNVTVQIYAGCTYLPDSARWQQPEVAAAAKSGSNVAQVPLLPVIGNLIFKRALKEDLKARVLQLPIRRKLPLSLAARLAARALAIFGNLE